VSDAQREANLITAALRIHDLQERELLKAPWFHVNSELAYASLKVLAALEDVYEDVDASVTTALRVMDQAATQPLAPIDRECVEVWLRTAEVEWPA
jgi:hypothetical protein